MCFGQTHIRIDEYADIGKRIMSAHRALPNYAWREPSIYGWFKTLAKNKARDLLRASGRRQRLRGSFSEHVDSIGGPPPPTTAGEEEVQRAQLRTKIEAVLETMNPRYASVLRMRLLEDRELYDLASDPLQKKNVIEKHPEVVADLAGMLTAIGVCYWFFG